jgi:hypothetical protein
VELGLSRSEEHRLRVFWNKELRRSKSGTNRDEITRE